MIQILTDGVVAYDSRLEEYDLQGLKVTTGLNKGGTAEITMPPGHPAYKKYASYKTIVEIYRDGGLKFRGRALYPTDDFYNRRTVLCEGELCFFQDAVSRPYLYQDTPAAIFTALIGVYNSQVETVKQFKVGEITVTDANEYVRLESEDAESVLDTIEKLLDRCGGYVVFTTDTDGARVVNWYATLGYRSGQVIEFGENLLDFARDGSNTNLVTVVIPYGAKDETTAERVTVESVNDGVDYVEDTDAVALRGRITKAVVWDDVTDPTNLMRKARQYLEQNRYIVTALELTALDLSYLDKSIDSYEVGDKIRVTSKPHAVDEDFLLEGCTEDLLRPENSKITLGRSQNTLTDADVAGDRQLKAGLHKMSVQLRAEYKTNTSSAVSASETTLKNEISQSEAGIRTEVSKTYVTNGQMTDHVATALEQTENGFNMTFENLSAKVDENDADARKQFTEIHKYISFENGDIKLGANDSAITLTIENDKIVFKKNGVQFGWWDGVDFHTGNIVVEVNERAQFGDFAFIPRSNGSLSFLKVGG